VQNPSAEYYKKLLAILSLFLKSEKIPALLYIGKGPSVIFDLFSQPTSLRHRSGTNRKSRKALLLYMNPAHKHISAEVSSAYVNRLSEANMQCTIFVRMFYIDKKDKTIIKSPSSKEKQDIATPDIQHRRDS
jgi:hypothetical protein